MSIKHSDIWVWGLRCGKQHGGESRLARAQRGYYECQGCGQFWTAAEVKEAQQIATGAAGHAAIRHGNLICGRAAALLVPRGRDGGRKPRPGGPRTRLSVYVNAAGAAWLQQQAGALSIGEWAERQAAG